MYSKYCTVCFAGYDLCDWLMDHLDIEDSPEALHLANLLCQHGYFFPITDVKNLSVKDDGSFYRFQVSLFYFYILIYVCRMEIQNWWF